MRYIVSGTGGTGCRVAGEGSGRIVSSGREALQGTAEYEAAVKEVRERAYADFEPLLERTGFLLRPVLRLQRWLRIRREINALAPRGGLYASNGTWRDTRRPDR